MENIDTIPLPAAGSPPPQGAKVRPPPVNRYQDILSRLHAGRVDDKDQSLQSLEQPDEIKVTEEIPSGVQDDWVISFKDELEQLHVLNDKATWRKLCIYKIPKYLHEMHHKSYSPQTISFGPYYNGVEHLQPMESHKVRAVNKILSRTKQSIEMYIDEMRKIEEKARVCYEGVISMSSDEFTKMLVLDGCFILEILYGVDEGFERRGYAHNDPVFAVRESIHLIQRDMMMLENQLPLFVLDHLGHVLLGRDDKPSSAFVAQLAINFLDPLILTEKWSSRKKMDVTNIRDNEMVHFLDAFRHSLALPTPYAGRTWKWETFAVDKRPQHMIRCVMKLRDVGIKFRQKESCFFWDIGFKDGYLEIPKLFIHEGTKSLFLNLIAFEESHLGSSNDVTSYIIFMDNLIDSAEDVSHLKKCGIIEHWLESDSEVADLFNQIGRQGIVFDIHISYLCKLSNEVAEYYEERNKYRKYYVWMKTLKEKYLDSPWGYISLLAAFILLVLTALQCYYAEYAYSHPSPSGDKKA